MSQLGKEELIDDAMYRRYMAFVPPCGPWESQAFLSRPPRMPPVPSGTFVRKEPKP
jgi:hypothetical protein